MAFRKLFLLAFLTAHVSCRKSSLTFVIDDTYSMNPEINQVKDAAKEIVDIVLNEMSSQIEDIVLVTFNDPDTVFRKRTNNGDELKQALDAIKVHGGGDCPEMALKGIKKGLEESQPGSYLFVFTDASAKDYKMFEEIKTLSQDKQIQIVIVVTNTARCQSSPIQADIVYNKIAAATNGMVFRINKDELGEVLEYVKETIKGDRTEIISTTVPANQWKDVEFKIDDQTEYAIVSATGYKVVLQIFDQRKRFISNVLHITWTDNVKSAKLSDVTPGSYIARVHGNTEVVIRIFGRTDFTFEHGFSTKVETSLRTTETQPTTDIETYLMVDVKDPKNSANVQSIELLDMSDRKIRTLPLTNVQGGLYATREKFLSPREDFKIAVIATSRSTGKTVRRIAKTPVTPIRPVYVAPELSKTEKYINVKEGASVAVHCRIIKGKPRPQITWYLKREKENAFSVLDGQKDDVLRVDNAQTNDYYMCLATNREGKDQHTLQLDVQARPVFENTPDVITKNEGEAVTFNCKFRKGNPRPKEIEWVFTRADANRQKILTFTGEQLNLRSVQLEDSGTYRCSASNTEGSVKKNTKLIVRAKPSIEKLESYKYVMENTIVNLQCRVTRGFPKPTVKWLYKNISSADYVPVSKQQESLRLDNVQLASAGNYKCVAKNVVGHDEMVVQLVVNAPPRIVFTPPNTPNYIGVEGDVVMRLPCTAVGHPNPKIEWVVDDKIVDSDKSKEMYVEANALVLKNPKESHSTSLTHAYVCKATNKFGEVEQIYDVEISVAPELSKTERYINVKEGASVAVHCRIIKGKPRPQITWYLKRENENAFSVLDGQKDDVLRVDNAQTNDYYMCLATNREGKDQHTLQLDVQARPVFENTPDVITKNEGEAVTFNCKFRKGNPRPKEIEWVFTRADANRQKLLTFTGEQLNLRSVQLEDSGTYRCSASNTEGSVKKNTKLIVQAKPSIEKLESYKYVMENTTVNLQCRVTRGFPKPTVKWSYKNISSADYVPVSKQQESLRLDNVQLASAGDYKCVAKNVVGHDEMVVQLVVNAPPRIEFTPPNTPNYIGVEGDVVMRLPCTAVGHPNPKIEWVVDDKIVDSDKSKEMYVEANALVLKNPKESHSTNLTHAYVCKATNKFGEVEQIYDVEISEYADVSEPDETTVTFEKKPYVVKCPLPYTDPNSVRWYKNAIYHNVTGPTLRFDDPTQSDSNNYTCRVSDMNHAESFTFEVFFGYPPTTDLSSLNVEWEGEEIDIDCRCNQYPEGKYDWYHNGKKIEGMHSGQLKLNDWGHYTCQVTNPLGSLVINYTVTTIDEACIIPKSLFDTKHMPLVFDSSSSWPTIKTVGEYLIVPHSEKLKLICQDDTNTKSARNSFKKFQNLESTHATCYNQESFLVDDVPNKFSDLDCKEDVTPSIKSTERPCQGDNTKLMKVGFYVNEFTEVYQACVDTIKNVPLYTKVNTLALEDDFESEMKVPKKNCMDECCYETIQLVNAIDVSFGPAKKATYRDNLNYVNYCKPNLNLNVTNWYGLETITRQKTRYTVWSGAVNYSKVGAIWTPKYLWKVLKELDSSDMIAIVHENVPKPGPKLCSGACGVSSDWFEPEGDRTYCCGLDDFKKAFGITIDFDEG